MIESPYYPTIQFSIPGLGSFDTIPPEFLVTATFTETVKGSSNFDINLFDKYWDTFISAPLKTGTKIEYRYGYASGEWSPIYLGQLIEMNLTLEQHGVNIALSGFGYALSTSAQCKHKGGFTGKRIDEVVNEIAEDMLSRGDIKGVDIEKCAALVSNDALTGTEQIERTKRQYNLSDYQFIQHLKQFAITEDGKGDFVFYVDSDEILHFHPPRFDRDTVKTYVFMRNKDSEVISFEPEFNNLLTYIGGGQLSVVSIDPITRKPLVTSVDQKDTDESDYENGDVNTDTKPNQNKPVNNPTSETVNCKQFMESGHRIISSPVRTRKEVTTKAVISQVHLESLIQSANLVVLGDPNIQPDTTIYVSVITDSGVEHFSSGKYYIEEVSHEISGGSYQTTMTLDCRGSKAKAEDAEGVEKLD